MQLPFNQEFIEDTNFVDFYTELEEFIKENIDKDN